MKKSVLVGILAGLMLIGLSFIILSQNTITGFSVYQTSSINEGYLEELKIKENVECLQNSQCLENQECVENFCLDKNSINLCKEVSLSTSSIKLKIGDSINSYKRVITNYELPFLLNKGKIIEIVNNETIEHLYVQNILIGYAEISKDNIQSKSTENNILIYRLTFSKNVDFSSKNIHGQALRILGEEYIIGDNSDNSKIELIKTNEDKKIKFEDRRKVSKGLFSNVEGTSVNLIKGFDKNISLIEIEFSLNSNMNENKEEINLKENFEDSVFEKIELSFDDVKGEYADVKIGGVC